MATTAGFTDTTISNSSAEDVSAIELPFAWFVILCVVSFVGCVGNAFIIGAVCLHRRLRVRGNAFIINLAVADLIVTSYMMPMGLATSRFKVPPFGNILCDINGFLVMCTCGVSTQSLMMVAFERYVTICKLHWYKRLFNTKMIALWILFCWIYSAIWTLQGWTGWTRYVYGKDIYLCLFDGPYSLSYDICLAVFGMVLPMLVLLFCYSSIFRLVWKSRMTLLAHQKASTNGTKTKTKTSCFSSEQRRMKREIRLAMTLFAIVILFIAFWALAAIVMPLSALWSGMPKILYTIAVWIALCNSCVNSFVYGAMNSNFRHGYRLFFSTIFCLRSCRKCRKRCRQRKASTSAGDTSTDKGTSPDTSMTQSTPTKKPSTVLHLKKRKSHQTPDANMDENISRHVTQTPNSISQPRKDTHFVQYVHLAEGEIIDYYASPILGATIISDKGVIETRL